MTGWEVFWIVIAVIVVALLLFNLRDLYRYIKISSM